MNFSQLSFQIDCETYPASYSISKVDIKTIHVSFICRGHPVVSQNCKPIINVFFFQLNTTVFYHLTYWRQVSVIRPSSGHLYIKFKTGYK